MARKTSVGIGCLAAALGAAATCRADDGWMHVLPDLSDGERASISAAAWEATQVRIGAAARANMLENLRAEVRALMAREQMEQSPVVDGGVSVPAPGLGVVGAALTRMAGRRRRES